MIPDLKLGVAVLTNQESDDAFNAIAYAVADALHRRAAQPVARGLPEDPGPQRRPRSPQADQQDRVGAQRRARSRRCRWPATPARYRDAWYGDIAIAEEGGKLVMRFTKTPSLVGDLEHWQYDTFVVRWRDRELRADAFVTFALNPDGTIDQAKMQAVSPSTDFSFDFQDLLLRPIK